MMHTVRKFRFVTLAALGSAALCAQAPAVLADSPFPRLVGNWSGTGKVRFEEGKTEAISCKAYYVPKAEGSAMGLAIRCASASYKIEMRANLAAQGDRVTGQWEERTFNAEGSLSRRATGETLKLAISGAVSGSMHVTLDQAGHRVDITTPGAGFAGVSINLTRG